MRLPILRSLRVLTLIVFPALLCFVALGCSSLEPVGETTAALTPGSFSVGNTSTVTNLTTYAINSMHKEGQLPRQPVGMETTASAWSDVWYVDNGGLCVLGPDGLHGSGDLNRARFYLYRVNTYGGSDYYVAQVDFFYTDGAGSCTYRPQATFVTAWPEDSVFMTWTAGSVKLVVKNPGGQITWDGTPYAFTFPAGIMPRKVHSAQMTLGMDTSAQYGGCMRDVPDYDTVDGSDNGHWKESNYFGDSSAAFPSYLSTPTSNAHCSIATNRVPNQYDLVQWHVDGF